MNETIFPYFKFQLKKFFEKWEYEEILLFSQTSYIYVYWRATRRQLQTQDPLEKCAVTPLKGAWILERGVTWPVLTGRISYRLPFASPLHDHTSEARLPLASLRPLLSLSLSPHQDPPPFLTTRVSRTSFTLKTVSRISTSFFFFFFLSLSLLRWSEIEHFVRVLNGRDTSDLDAGGMLCTHGYFAFQTTKQE